MSKLKSILEQPVTIHFKEDSIPGLRRGVMTDESKAAILQSLEEIIAKTRKDTASEIFNLAHKYAQDDVTMKGSENLRYYHYYNAIHKVGEFDGR